MDVQVENPAGEAVSLSELVDPRGAGAHLGGSKPIAVGTLAEWRCQKIGPPYFKLGRLIRYRISDLDAWVESNRVAAVNE